MKQYIASVANSDKIDGDGRYIVVHAASFEAAWEFVQQSLHAWEAVYEISCGDRIVYDHYNGHVEFGHDW